MKTIIHITLSDSERNDLARRVDRDPVTRRFVTRKEVTEYVLALVQQEIEDGRDQDNDVETVSEPDGTLKTGPVGTYVDFKPSRGDEDYLAQPKDAGVAAACSRILDDTALIEQFAWDTVERNRGK